MSRAPINARQARRERVDMRLLRRIRESHDTTARAELIDRMTPLVRSLASRYAGRGEELDDLVQVGHIGLVKAMNRFDPDAGYRFVSFAAPNITGEIRRHFRDHCWAVHVPRGTKELDARISLARKTFLAANGREPSDADLSTILRLSTSEIAQAKAAALAFRSVSTSAPIGDGVDLLDTYGADDTGYEHVDELAMLHETLSVLDSRERNVLRLRFEHEMLQREIAETIGVSQMQISRIITVAIDHMRQHLAATGEDVPQLCPADNEPKDRRAASAAGNVRPAHSRPSA